MTAGSAEPVAPVLVLGLGNLLLGDDAIGLKLLELLSGDGDAGPAVEFIDGGTQGLALLPYLDGRRALLVLDAIGFGAPPGTVHVVTSEQIDQLGGRRASTAHEGNALELLATARLLGSGAEDTTVVGIEPATVSTGIGLSPEVEAAVPKAVEKARGILRGWREAVPASSPR